MIKPQINYGRKVIAKIDETPETMNGAEEFTN